MKFRGPQALSNRPQKAMVCPTCQGLPCGACLVAAYGHYRYNCRQQAWDATMQGNPAPQCRAATRLAG